MPSQPHALSVGKLVLGFYQFCPDVTVWLTGH